MQATGGIRKTGWAACWDCASAWMPLFDIFTLLIHRFNHCGHHVILSRLTTFTAGALAAPSLAPGVVAARVTCFHPRASLDEVPINSTMEYMYSRPSPSRLDSSGNVGYSSHRTARAAKLLAARVSGPRGDCIARCCRRQSDSTMYVVVAGYNERLCAQLPAFMYLSIQQILLPRETWYNGRAKG